MRRTAPSVFASRAFGHRALAAGSALVSVAVVAACAVGPDTGPGFVRGENNGGPGAPASAAAQPPLEVPGSDVAWHDCTDTQTERSGLKTAPPGTSLSCATIQAPIAPGTDSSDTVDVDLVRASLASTPKNAAPVVLTTGSDIESGVALTLLAASDGAALLRSHPVVAVDRRALGPNTIVDCLTKDDRATIYANGSGSDNANVPRATRLGRAANSAADGCNDMLAPNQADYPAKYAAADLEVLRAAWKVKRIGLIGIGDGATVAGAYAAQFPDHVGRLVFDTPAPYATSMQETASQIAAGTDAAMTGFADQCRALSCALGSDPRTAIASLLAKARSGGLPGLSDTEVLSAIRLGIGTYAGDRSAAITSTATMLADAANGNVAALQAAATRAHTVFDSDGQLLARCADTNAPVGQAQAIALMDQWGKQYPLTGYQAALDTQRCNGWPAIADPAPTPKKLTTPTLLLNGGFDPINGNKGIDGVRAFLITAGAPVGVTTWAGLGYSALMHSDCAATTVGRYLDSGAPAPSSACPA
jgi:pimeloyl-ACP methyl ester carboxylesterase